MARNMSFSITTDQIVNQTKTVTRRLGWLMLKPGDQVIAVKKAMGLKKGETVERLAKLRIVDVRLETLNHIDQADCVAEGFPDMTPDQFVEMFCKHNKCTPFRIVNRIQFDYVEVYP